MEPIVVIPVYEPEECLSGLLDALEDRGYRILVVNDGSDPFYDDVFEAMSGQAVVLRHQKNRGKGAALKTAFCYLKDQGMDLGLIGVMDGDGQHLPEDMERLFQRAGKKRGSLVLGVRNIGKRMPIRSRFGNRLTREIFHLVSGTYLQDTQSGLRAFSAELLEDFLQVPGEKYEYETNQLLYCTKRGIRVEEVPIRTVYADRENSTSHFRVLWDSIRIYGEFFKFAGSSLASFCLDYLLFGLFVYLFHGGFWELLLSNLAARVLSASFNYCVNTRMVFRQRMTSASAAGYLALALGIFAGNNLLLSFYTQLLGLPAMGAKLLTEISLFLISFFVQGRLIFRKTGMKKTENTEVIL